MNNVKHKLISRRNSGFLLTSYSELASAKYLLNQVGEGKSVSIIRDSYCANQSIAIAKDRLVIGKSSCGGLKYEPYAITHEANFIEELFEARGIAADVKIYGPLSSNPLCWTTEKGRSKIAKACENSDIAIGLCCYLGAEGIKSALQISIKVVPAMTTVGQITSYLTKQKEKIILNKDKTKIYHFKEMKQTRECTIKYISE